MCKNRLVHVSEKFSWISSYIQDITNIILHLKVASSIANFDRS